MSSYSVSSPGGFADDSGLPGFAGLARRRKMTRHFLADPIDDVLLERVLDTARRVPSAGNAQGFDFVVLVGPEATGRYWDITLAPARRETFRWSSLLRCPVLVTVWADPGAYARRYSEPDKTGPKGEGSDEPGSGRGPEAWATPYWTVDAAFAALALQYAAIDVGLGVLFFGMFAHEKAVAEALRVPSNHSAVGTVALGWPDTAAESAAAPAASQNRPRRPTLFGDDPYLRPVVHRDHWLGRW